MAGRQDSERARARSGKTVPGRPRAPGAAARGVFLAALAALAACLMAVPAAGGGPSAEETWNGARYAVRKLPAEKSGFHAMLARLRGQGTAWKTSKAWRACMQRASGRRGAELLKAVHVFWAAFPHEKDIYAYGSAEWWATPAEFIERGHGDCEDRAIIRYFSLKELGIPARDMRILGLRREQGAKGWPPESRHAVLEVRLDGRRYILDHGKPPLAPDAFLRQTGYAPWFAVFETEGGGDAWILFRAASPP